MTVVHPELASEQDYVTTAYESLDRGLAQKERDLADYRATDRNVHRAIRKQLDDVRNSTSPRQLVFGRLDKGVDAPLYVGRRVVFDDDHNVLVAGWHAPAAAAFYRASAGEPGDVALKRTFVEEERRLIQLIDEILRRSAAEASAPTPRGESISDALLAELERSRDGAMRDVVATIQSEQYRIIRSPRDGVLVVQGGPGTGKTVIGLHRAAWLALNDAELRRQGLLIVSPNAALLSYTSGVLPGLDVDDLRQSDITGLYAGEARVTGVDDELADRVKGSAAMAHVLRRALDARVGWSGGDLTLVLGPVRVVVPKADLVALVDDVRSRQVSHSEGRTLVRARLSRLALNLYREASREAGRLAEANGAAIRRLIAFTNAVNRMWPTFSPEEFLRSLYGTQTTLVAAAEGVLTAEERAALFRSPTSSIADEPWTAADLLCLDELAGLLTADETHYGHVVVDEAQDLTPMQARALARRCPSGSFTVLGDLAQATGSVIRDDWSELTQHFGSAETVFETLPFCYRVPGPALDLAARQLPLISPDLKAPTSVRLGRFAPAATRVGEEDLLAESLRRARSAADAGGAAAVIVPDSLYESVLHLGGDGVGDGRAGDFSRPVTVVPATLAKGLEFDAVVVVAPERFVADHDHGRRLLYIALTRCTQQLELVHAGNLPAGLDHLDVGRELVEEVFVEPLPAPAMTAARPELADLVARLDEADRELVQALVERLLAAPSARVNSWSTPARPGTGPDESAAEWVSDVEVVAEVRPAGGMNTAPVVTASSWRTKRSTANPADVRAWGRLHGWAVAERGRLRPDLVAAYEAAQAQTS